MIAVGTNALRWAADAAGLALIEIRPDTLDLNDAAVRAAGIVAPRDLHSALAAIVRCEPADPAIARILAAVDAPARAVELIGTPPSRVVVIPGGPGTPTCVLVAPAQIAQSAEIQRRAAVSDLAAGAAHELANSLGAIAGWAELAQTADAPQVADALALIESSARNARGAARSLLAAVSGSGPTATGPVDVSSLVEEALKLIRPVAQRSSVSVDVQIDPDLRVLGQAGDLWTIVSNLAHNAIEAQPDGGAVRIVVAGSTCFVRISVADDGPGMDDATRRRIFEPYFTTKAHGTGLGLALVRRSVDALGGSLVLASRQGGGTEIHVELPRTAEAAAPEPTPIPSKTIAFPATRAAMGVKDSRSRRRSGVREAAAARSLVSRVLVVDDDASIAALMETALSLRGATVTIARNGAEALALTGPFDVAIVDLTLPDVRGDVLLAQLRERQVVRTAAIASGAEPPARVASRGAPDAWLRKPFELDDLASLVRVLLKPAKKSRARRAP
jgi:signal transduction histidine kinase/ActR/RegA family two-component response regulator